MSACCGQADRAVALGQPSATRGATYPTYQDHGLCQGEEERGARFHRVTERVVGWAASCEGQDRLNQTGTAARRRVMSRAGSLWLAHAGGRRGRCGDSVSVFRSWRLSWRQEGPSETTALLLAASLVLLSYAPYSTYIQYQRGRTVKPNIGRICLICLCVPGVSGE